MMTGSEEYIPVQDPTILDSIKIGRSGGKTFSGFAPICRQFRSHRQARGGGTGCHTPMVC